MKQVLLLFVFAAVTLGTQAQGKGKGKEKAHKEAKGNSKHMDQDPGWGHPPTTSPGKRSKNQPAKVRSSFEQDFPNASNVVWGKYKGDWTARFNNGPFVSTAVYHANGQRRDTRTPITRDRLPGTIWDRIFKRDRVTPTGNIIRIESPSLASEIFRIGSGISGKEVRYLYYDGNGNPVKYDY